MSEGDLVFYGTLALGIATGLWFSAALANTIVVLVLGSVAFVVSCVLINELIKRDEDGSI